MEYHVKEYIAADIEVTDLSAADYIKKESLALIADKLQRIVDAEAPIMYPRISAALAASAEKGLKYGRKTGKIVQDEDKRFTPSN